MIATDMPFWDTKPEGLMFWLTLVAACIVMGLAVTAVGWLFRKLRLAIRYLVGV